MGRFVFGSLGDRPFFFPAVFLLVGVALGPTRLPSIVTLGLAFVFLGLAALFSGRVGAHLAVLSAAALLGVGLATLHARVQVPTLTFEPRKNRLAGEVASAAAVEGGTSVVLRVTSVEGAAADFRARLYVEGVQPLVAGDQVLVATQLKPLTGAANPGERDRSNGWARSGLVASGSARREAIVLLGAAPGRTRRLERERLELSRRAHAVASDPDAAALYVTLAAGLRSELGPQLEADFAKSGLAHVLSVSGLHVAALALALLALVRRAVVRLPLRALRRIDARRLAAPLSVPLLWAYVAFTGYQPPAVRSALMATVWLLGLTVVRRSDGLNSLSLTVLVVAAIDPAAVADLSMQLSVAAVLGLIFLAPRLRALLPVPLPSPKAAQGLALMLERAREAALGSACASVAATLATAPLLAAAFHRVGWVGVLANAGCVPLNAAVSVAAAAGAAVSVAAPGLSAPVLWVGDTLALALVWAARLFAALPSPTFTVPAPTALACALWWLGLGGLALWGRLGRAVALLSPVAAALALVASSRPAEVLEVTFLSVGHGDAVVLSSRGHHALIDGGGAARGGAVGRRVVASFLKERRVDTLDLAALTHPHPDHAVGLAEALSEVGARTLWLPRGSGQGALLSAVLRATPDATPVRVQAGDAFTLGDARLEVLGPPVDRVLLESENDRSLVLRVRHGAVSFLLTGDIEEAGEEALDPGQVTVVKAPHHGSDTSSSARLVQATRPRFVVFCVGLNHRFRFPRAEVVQRWEAAGARCYRTDLDGAITFRSDGRDVAVETFHRAERAQARRVPDR